jgi:hypothetical protein
MDIIWLYFSVVLLIGPYAGGETTVACGSGPHILESNKLLINVKTNQSTIVLLTKNVSMLTKNVSWWAKQKSMRLFFNTIASFYRNGTKLILSVTSPTVDKFRVRYRMFYNDGNGSVLMFTSDTAEVLLRGTFTISYSIFLNIWCL